MLAVFPAGVRDNPDAGPASLPQAPRMRDYRVLILGGSGAVGRRLARVIGPHATVVFAGRDRVAAEAAAQRAGTHAVGMALDVRDAERAREVIASGFELVVDASGVDEARLALAQATLAAGADWVDFGGRSLAPLAPAVRDAGRCFVTEAGVVPGLAGVLTRWALASADEITSGVVAALLPGARRSPQFARPLRVCFAFGFGEHWAHVRGLPELRELRTPLRFAVAPQHGTQATIIQLDAQGIDDGGEVDLRVAVSHRSRAELTAAAGAVAIRRLQAGAGWPGVHRLGALGDPHVLLAELAAAGAEVVAARQVHAAAAR